MWIFDLVKNTSGYFYYFNGTKYKKLKDADDLDKELNKGHI